jgi:hypothetical protein
MKISPITIDTVKALVADDSKLLVLDGRNSSSPNCMSEYNGNFSDVDSAELVTEAPYGDDYIVVWKDQPECDDFDTSPAGNWY